VPCVFHNPRRSQRSDTYPITRAWNAVLEQLRVQLLRRQASRDSRADQNRYHAGEHPLVAAVCRQGHVHLDYLQRGSGATAPGETAVYNSTPSPTTTRMYRIEHNSGVAACTNNNVSALLVTTRPRTRRSCPQAATIRREPPRAWSHSARPTGQSRSSKSGSRRLLNRAHHH